MQKLKEARTKYIAHITKMLTMAGDKKAAEKAKKIVALETELAKVQWTKVENRDPIKVYNKEDLAQFMIGGRRRRSRRRAEME